MFKYLILAILFPLLAMGQLSLSYSPTGVWNADSIVIASGSNIDTVRNQVGSLYDVGRVGAAYPQLVSGVLNRPIMRFDQGAGTKYLRANKGLGETGNAPMTFAFVVKATENANINALLQVGDSLGAAGQIFQIAPSGTVNTTDSLSTRHNNGNKIWNTVSMTSAWKVYVVVQETNYQSARAYVNGVAVTATDTTNGTNVHNLTNEEFIIGGGRTAAATILYYWGDIACIAFWSEALTAEQALVVSGELNCYYGNIYPGQCGGQVQQNTKKHKKNKQFKVFPGRK